MHYEQESDHVTVLFLDHGEVGCFLRNSLCKIEPQFVDLAPFAIRCTLFNTQLANPSFSTQVGLKNNSGIRQAPYSSENNLTSAYN